MGIGNVISLFCGLSLFLFGMNLMGNGLRKVSGEKLEVVLYKLSSNPLKGVLLGTGVTAVIQSSSATSVMVVGFVNSGMMKVRQAIGIIMGAIIGTSITGWVICLSAVGGSGIFEIISTDTLTTVMAVVGIVLLMFTKKEKNHQTASILLGFAVLMVGISLMTDAVYPLRESKAFIDMLTGFSNPIVGILVGLLFTCLIQSASAAVGILQTLAVTGAISFHLALPVIMGIAIGASVPVLLSALGANASGKRTALIYLIVDTLGALLFGIIFYSANAIFHFDIMDSPMSMMSVALLNTLFRVAIILMLFPMIGIIEKFVNAIVKEKKENIAELKDAERLEERFLTHPALAIEQVKIAIHSMAELACESIFEAMRLFDTFSDAGFKRVYDLEEIIDTYEDRVGNYLVRIMKNELEGTQNSTVNMFLHSVNDFERLGDHAKNLAESAKEIFDKKIILSNDAESEMKNLFAAITEILSNMKSAFVDEDIDAAYRIAPLEELIDNFCSEYKRNHINRVQSGICLYNHGFVFNDMLTDLERVGDHCSNLGIAIRIRHGEMSDRHGTMTKQEIEKTHDYKKLYGEYAEKFRIE